MSEFHKKNIRLLSTIGVTTMCFTGFSDIKRRIGQLCRMSVHLPLNPKKCWSLTFISMRILFNNFKASRKPQNITELFLKLLMYVLYLDMSIFWYLTNVFYFNYWATTLKVTSFIYTFHVPVPMSDLYQGWSHSTTIGLKVFCTDTTNQIWKKYKGFSWIIFLHGEGNSSAHLYLYIVFA